MKKITLWRTCIRGGILISFTIVYSTIYVMLMVRLKRNQEVWEALQDDQR